MGMTPNEQMLAQATFQKADLELANLQVNGGYLQPAQAKEFFKLLIKKSVLLPMVTTVTMEAHTREVDTIRFSGQVLRGAAFRAPLPKDERAAPDTGKVTLNSQLLKGEIRLGEEVVEDNIEQGRFLTTVQDLMAEAVARDSETLLLNGDTVTLPADPLYTLLKVLDGIRKLATTNLVNAAGAKLERPLLKTMFKTMPDEYAYDKAKLRFLAPRNCVVDYVDSLAQRATVLGDRYVQENVPPTAFGIPVEEVPLLPETLGIGSNYADAFLLDPKNIQWGIWRKAKFASQHDIVAGEYITVVSMRVAVQYAHEPAVVKAHSVLAA